MTSNKTETGGKTILMLFFALTNPIMASNSVVLARNCQKTCWSPQHHAELGELQQRRAYGPMLGAWPGDRGRASICSRTNPRLWALISRAPASSFASSRPAASYPRVINSPARARQGSDDILPSRSAIAMAVVMHMHVAPGVGASVPKDATEKNSLFSVPGIAAHDAGQRRAVSKPD